MSGPTPFPPPSGLTALGSADAAMCVDGVCLVPAEAEQVSAQAEQAPAEAEQAPAEAEQVSAQAEQHEVAGSREDVAPAH